MRFSAECFCLWYLSIIILVYVIMHNVTKVWHLGCYRDGWDELLVTKGFESMWFGHYLMGGWRPHASDE